MKGHSVIGSRMFDNSRSPILTAAADICRSHHEKWDGSGYPYGLKGEEIPLFGRITAVVDVFDALTSVRCYKPAWDFDEAVKLIKSESGKHFDPRIVNAFIKALPMIRHIYDSNKMIQSFVTDYEVLSLRDFKEERETQGPKSTAPGQ